MIPNVTKHGRIYIGLGGQIGKAAGSHGTGFVPWAFWASEIPKLTAKKPQGRQRKTPRTDPRHKTGAVATRF